MSFIVSRLTLADFQPEDDIDKLFKRLSQVEPSGELVSRILAHVRRMPVSSERPPAVQKVQQDRATSEEMDPLVVRNEKRDPS